jgi:hypothetical protein
MRLVEFIVRQAENRGIQLSKPELARLVKAAKRDMREGGKGAMREGLRLALDCKRLTAVA